MSKPKYERTCKCGNKITLSAMDEGNIVQCQFCELYMKVLNTRLCHIVSNQEIEDIRSGRYSREAYSLLC